MKISTTCQFTAFFPYKKSYLALIFSLSPIVTLKFNFITLERCSWMLMKLTHLVAMTSFWSTILVTDFSIFPCPFLAASELELNFCGENKTKKKKGHICCLCHWEFAEKPIPKKVMPKKETLVRTRQRGLLRLLQL